MAEERSGLPDRRVVNWLMRTARRDPLYTADPDIALPDVAGLFSRRALDAVRGVVLGLRVRRARQPCFVGRAVKVMGARHLSMGRGCVLQDYVLIDAVSRSGVVLGDNVTLERYVIVRCTGALRELGEGVSIGDNSSLGAFSFVGGSGGLTIGRNVLGGQRLSFHPENHVFGDVETSIREQGSSRVGIVVEDDCWLGSGSTYLDGVTVGRGSVVGAGSVVTRDVPAFSRVAGVPARVVGARRPGDESR